MIVVGFVKHLCRIFFLLLLLLLLPPPSLTKLSRTACQHVSPLWPSHPRRLPSLPPRACLQRLASLCHGRVCGYLLWRLHASKGHHISSSFVEGPSEPNRLGSGDVAMSNHSTSLVCLFLAPWSKLCLLSLSPVVESSIPLELDGAFN